MYCLTFNDACGKIEKRFYYNNFVNAVKMQRDFLIIEINKLVSEETDEGPFKFSEHMCNNDLQRLLRVLIMLTYKDDFDRFEITVDINEVSCEDKLLIDY